MKQESYEFSDLRQTFKRRHPDNRAGIGLTHIKEKYKRKPYDVFISMWSAIFYFVLFLVVVAATALTIWDYRTSDITGGTATNSKLERNDTLENLDLDDEKVKTVLNIFSRVKVTRKQ